MRKKLYIFKHFAKRKKLFFCQYLSFSVWFPLSLKHWSPLIHNFNILKKTLYSRSHWHSEEKVENWLERKKGLIKKFYVMYCMSTIMKNPLDSRAADILKLGEEGSCWGRRFTVFVWQLKFNDDMSCTPIQFFLSITSFPSGGQRYSKMYRLKRYRYTFFEKKIE